MTETVTKVTKDWLRNKLYFAYLEARKGKRDTGDEFTFEVNWMDNLERLVDDIYNMRYKPSRGIAFPIHRPVAREVFAAPFRDRIVHHFIVNMVKDWWDRRLIYDSYSCREGKGTLKGIERMEGHIRAVTKCYTRTGYIFKFDIQGYFMSLNREKLYERISWGLNRQFADEPELYKVLDYLWKEIIFDDPIQGVRRRGTKQQWALIPDRKSLFHQPEGQGIVIGNLSSQWLSNIYLDQLDRFVRFTLGYKHYGRYVDDFYIVVPAEEYTQMLADIARLRRFLDGIGLTLHPNKIRIRDVRDGMEFLGTVLYPYRRIPGKRFAGNFWNAMEEVAVGMRSMDTLTSYVGHGKFMSSKALIRRALEHIGAR